MFAKGKSKTFKALKYLFHIDHVISSILRELLYIVRLTANSHSYSVIQVPF